MDKSSNIPNKIMDITLPSTKAKSSRTRTKSSRTRTLKSNLPNSINKSQLFTPKVSLRNSITKKKSAEEKINTNEINELNFSKLANNDDYNNFILRNKKILQKSYEKINYLSSFNETEYDTYCELSSKVPLKNSQIKSIKQHI